MTAVSKTPVLARGLKTGDLVTVPAGGGRRRRVVVESVALDGERFTDTAGNRHDAGDAELVPLAGAREG